MLRNVEVIGCVSVEVEKDVVVVAEYGKLNTSVEVEILNDPSDRYGTVIVCVPVEYEVVAEVFENVLVNVKTEEVVVTIAEDDITIGFVNVNVLDDRLGNTPT